MYKTRQEKFDNLKSFEYSGHTFLYSLEDLYLVDEYQELAVPCYDSFGNKRIAYFGLKIGSAANIIGHIEYMETEDGCPVAYSRNGYIMEDIYADIDTTLYNIKGGVTL